MRLKKLRGHNLPNSMRIDLLRVYQKRACAFTENGTGRENGHSKKDPKGL